MRLVVLLAVLLALAPLRADPLKSAACDAALARLDAARAAAPASVEARRRDATRVCLGLASQAPVPTRSNRWAQPPIAVPPPVIEPPPRPPAALAAKPLPPPVHIERPPVVTSCDLTGCWTSDGTRLQRAGPGLMGPQGPCVVQGGLAFCH
jgi:hypothetical protein